MFPAINPKKMQALMKQMGIKQQEIPASKVIIEKTDNTKTIIENPSVTKIKIQGQETWQITGNEREEGAEAAQFSEQDIKIIIEKTGCSEQQAKRALEKTRDLAQAILELSQK